MAGRVVAALIALLTLATASAAWQADIDLYGRASTVVLGDIATGLAFPVAALIGRGSLAQRVLVALVGPAWLAGSVWDWAIALHQGAVISMLGAYPSGRLRKAVVPLATGAVIAVVIPGPLVTSGALLALAVGVTLIDLRSPLQQRGYPIVVAPVLALALLHAHWLAAHGRAAEPLLYQAAMIVVAVGFVAATRLFAGASRTLQDRLVGTGAGLDGLSAVLADLLREPRLSLVPGAGAGRPVSLDGEIVASIDTSSSVLTDPGIAAAVDESVRLLVRHHRLRAADDACAVDLERSRRRILAAVDHERVLAAKQLTEQVARPVDAAVARLAAHETPGLAQVVELLSGVRAEIAELVAGAPLQQLGDGRLAITLLQMASASPVPATVHVMGRPAASPDVEMALFYICREALTNAVKHAAASAITIELTEADGVLLTISDDGCGGADPTGTGLSALADRAAAIGARLELVSPANVGTRISVRV